MSRIGVKSYQPSPGEEWVHVSMKPASMEAVLTVMSADPDDPEGRSEMLWIRLPNGDLVLGCYPQSDTYMATEWDHS